MSKKRRVTPTLVMPLHIRVRHKLNHLKYILLLFYAFQIQSCAEVVCSTKFRIQNVHTYIPNRLIVALIVQCFLLMNNIT